MSRDPVEFEAIDADGNTHRYSCNPHPPSKGIALCMQMAQMTIGPAGDLLSSPLPKVLNAIRKAAFDDGAENLFEILESMDFEQMGLDKLKIGEGLSGMFGMIMACGNDEFFKNLLSFTLRDGERLDKTHVFDSAYGANYLELFEAASQVVKVNGFLDSWRFLASKTGLLEVVSRATETPENTEKAQSGSRRRQQKKT